MYTLMYYPPSAAVTGCVRLLFDVFKVRHPTHYPLLGAALLRFRGSGGLGAMILNKDFDPSSRATLLLFISLRIDISQKF
jgi:hypothetical protein